MKNYLTFLSVFLTTILFAQERVKKVEFYGGARTNILFQNLDDDKDTLNVQKSNYGHSLIDLGILIRPSADTEIMTELRMRNELGGFYGAAVNFGVRRMTLKGIINDAVRYKIGDIDLKLTPYTLYNNGYQDRINEASVFNVVREVVDYENFYANNTWRRQGIQSQFVLDLMNEKFKTIHFNLFSTRNNSANGQINLPERLYSGGSAMLKTSFANFSLNSANMHDLKNTIDDSQLYYNYVNTLSAHIPLNFIDSLTLNIETGTSTEKFDNVLEEVIFKKQDYFWNLSLDYHKSNSKEFNFSAIYTGPFFRSLGAQNVRLDYQSNSGIFPVITNDQIQREMGLIDYLYNDVLYRKTFDNTLDMYNPSFSNVLPYGLATSNRQGISAGTNYSLMKNAINLKADIFALQEVIGSGTLELKKFLKASLKADVVYKNWELKSGFTFEKTLRNGQSFEQVDLTSLLLDFGLDYKLDENIYLLYGVKYHMSDGNDLLPVYDSQNQIIYFNDYTIQNQTQYLNAIGVKVAFNKNSTLTLSYNSFVQSREVDYRFNQFHVLYRLNL